MDPKFPTTAGIPTQRSRTARRWAAGIASTLAATLLAGGGIAVALQAQGAAQGTQQAAADTGADESLDSLTSLDSLAADITDDGVQAPAVAEPAALVVPAAGTTPSPSSSVPAKHPARAALRRVLAVIIRQDGQPTYGQHAQTAARALINRYPAAFRRLPEQLRQDLWTLAGAPADQTVADAHTVRDRALDGTYGAAVQKLAEAMKNAPAKPKPTSPAPSATPGATSGS
ncbi:hypothetical protein SPF06_09600 [Sinomonas sp. JGH33]|uniref:Uncharacterized protein n=1 Tax=Sinomonas terricola TaxID=3110330 RepID=A0ABU5T5W1_9MICC|nr:hypothetical protein [Sinomonas sp. JGH33]MEA5454973.1 hypothetical protein [Sinomonas sp. JGH33]